MARPERHDIDYFPFYVKEGRTLFILENKYGALGTGVFTNLFRFLSKTPDHHFQVVTESDQLYLTANLKCDLEIGMEIIEVMVTTGKLDKDLWEQKRVIASVDFLESIKDAYKKRNSKCIEISSLRAFYGITGAGNPEKQTINPQRKGKERKGEETKEENTGTEPFGSDPDDSEIFIRIQTNRNDENYPVLKADILEWKELFPAVDVEQEIRKMVAWSKANSKKRKTKSGMKRFITAWLSREQDKGGSGYGPNKSGPNGDGNKYCRSDDNEYPPDKVY